jgi:hypothetical protein
MTKSITAHFDGQNLVPDEPLELPIGQPLKVQIQFGIESAGRFAGLRALAADLPDAPSDIALRHDHYLHGTSNSTA